jgi:hypothetical protein
MPVETHHAIGRTVMLRSKSPEVHYKKNVSDTWLRRFLVAVAHLCGGDVTVHSGDREFVPKGGSKKSQHLLGRAADLKVSGLSPKQVFERLSNAAEQLPAPLARYQILHHGPFTATEAEHVHIGRYGFLQKESDRPGFDFWVEGDSLTTRGKYRKVSSVDRGERLLAI